MKHMGNKTRTLWAKRIYEDFESEVVSASDIQVKDGFMFFLDEHGKPIKVLRASDVVMVS